MSALPAPEVYTGVFPMAPTPFHDDGTLDRDSMCRVLDCMIDQSVDGICILANYSEQDALSSEERDILLDLCMEHVAGRTPVIVTCSHYSTDVAVTRAVAAQRAGAAMLMLTPPYRGNGLEADDDGVFEHFERTCEAVDIPLMVQDAPASFAPLSVPLLTRMARELDNVCYFKIETSDTPARLRSLVESGGKAIIGPFDGEKSVALMSDLDAGATGTMPSALQPDLIGGVIRNFLAGCRDEAVAEFTRIQPLISYEHRQCGLAATKEVMVEGGVISSARVRHPLQGLQRNIRQGLIDLARQVRPLAIDWGR